jgi:hypothetical protein
LYLAVVAVFCTALFVTIWVATPVDGGASDLTKVTIGVALSLAVFFALAFRYTVRAPLVLRKAHPYKQV